MIRGTRKPTSKSDSPWTIAFLAKVITVIAPEDDNGFVAQAEFVKSGEHTADLLIHEANGCIVSADHLASLSGRRVATNEKVRISLLNRNLRKTGWGRGTRSEIWRQRHLCRII